MKKLIIISLVLMLFSCRTYKLTKEDLEWQPYKKGDVLVFKSNRGELDTIQIKSVEIHTNPDDPLALFPNKVQSLFVVGKSEILKLHAGKNGHKIEFKIHLGSNDLKSPVTILYLDEDSLFYLKEVEYNNKKSYKITAKESRGNMQDRSFDLRYIYWSKEYGYLGFEFKDNYVWALKSFIRDGNEIL